MPIIASGGRAARENKPSPLSWHCRCLRDLWLDSCPLGQFSPFPGLPFTLKIYRLSGSSDSRLSFSAFAQSSRLVSLQCRSGTSAWPTTRPRPTSGNLVQQLHRFVPIWTTRKCTTFKPATIANLEYSCRATSRGTFAIPIVAGKVVLERYPTATSKERRLSANTAHRLKRLQPED